MTLRAMFAGIEKPIPMLPPEGERICELMPISSPWVLTSAPPELPWLIGASVWMKSSKLPSPAPPVARPLALTIPIVTVWPIAERVADRQHDVADAHVVGVAERQGLQVVALDLQHGEIARRVGADDLAP